MMKRKPYRVTMTYLKNVAQRNRPPVYEKQSKDETFWGFNAADAERKCRTRYGHQVTVKRASLLPGWEKVTF